MYLPRDFITISCCPISSSITRPAILSPFLTMTTIRLSSGDLVLSTSSTSVRRIRGITVPLKLITSLFSTSLISLGEISSIVWMDPREIAYFSPPTTTISAWIIARVRGSRMVQVLPSPHLDFTSTSPLKDSILDLTTSRPTPLPETSVTFSEVENPGWNSRLIISFSDILAACSVVTRLRSIALFLTASTSIPLPSSLTSMTTLLPS